MKRLSRVYLPALILVLLLGSTTVEANTPNNNQDGLKKPVSLAQNDPNEALQVALGNAEIAEIISGKNYQLTDIKPYFGNEFELTIDFLEHFQYRGMEIAQLKVFVDIGTKSVVGFYLLDKGVIPYPAGGRVVLTEAQEQQGLEIALIDPLVSTFLKGKKYTITRMDGMPVWSSDFTGKPGVSITFTLDREYDFNGDVYNPPYADTDTHHLNGKVNGLDVISNLQWGQVVHMWPHVSSVPRPVSQLLLYFGVVAGSVLIGLGVYALFKRRGYSES